MGTLEPMARYLGLGIERKTEPEIEVYKKWLGPIRWLGEDIMGRV